MFVSAYDSRWTEMEFRAASSSMASCGEFTYYFLELNDIEQEREGSEAVDDDSLRTPDGLFARFPYHCSSKIKFMIHNILIQWVPH